MVTRHLKHFVASVLLIHRRTLKSLNVYSKAFLFFLDKEVVMVGHVSFHQNYKKALSFSFIVLRWNRNVFSELLNPEKTGMHEL